MTRQETFDRLVEQLRRPDIAAKVEKIESLCKKERILGIDFHIKRASNMLDSLQKATDSDRQIYETSFDTSIKTILNLLDKYS